MVLELKNVQENLNALFNRKEIKADVELDITPNREEVLKALSKKFSCPEDTISIIRIGSNFGTKVFTIVADIYKSKEAKQAIAVKRKKELEAEKKKIQDAKPKEVVEAKEEKSVEPKVEEKPVKQLVEKPKEEKPVEDNAQKETEEVKEESPEQGEEKKNE